MLSPKDSELLMIATFFYWNYYLLKIYFSADKEMLSTEDSKLLMIAIFLLKIKYCYLLKITSSLLTIMKCYLLKIANCWKQHLLSNEDSVLLSTEDSKIQTNTNSNPAFPFKFYIHSSIQIPCLPSCNCVLQHPILHECNKSYLGFFIQFTSKSHLNKVSQQLCPTQLHIVFIQYPF